MKFKALITTLILSISAASSVALAKPVLDLRYEANAELSFRDQRGPWRPTWAPLSQTITASRRNVIAVAENRDNLNAIRLQNGSGATYIYSLTLRYEDGSRKTITVGKWLYAGAPLLTFDLDQRKGGLDRIVVNTWTNQRATYQVFGQQMRRIVRPPVVEPLPPAPPPLPPAPVAYMIGTDLTFANTPGYVHIPVGTDKGRFQKMRIEATGASTFIGRVYVTFATGKQQMFDLDRSMYRGETLTLDIEGKGAHAVIAVTLMQGNNVTQVGPSASKFNVSLL